MTLLVSRYTAGALQGRAGHYNVNPCYGFAPNVKHPTFYLASCLLGQDRVSTEGE